MPDDELYPIIKINTRLDPELTAITMSRLEMARSVGIPARYLKTNRYNNMRVTRDMARRFLGKRFGR